MAITNTEIAHQFETLADLLEIQDANPFRVAAYRSAAAIIKVYPHRMCALLDRGEDLSRLPRIGHDLAEKIATLCRTGRLPLLEEAALRTPKGLSRLMGIPGLGPKRVKALYQNLDIRSAEDLLRAARSGQVRELPGFGPNTEAAIVRHLAQPTTTTRMSRSDARAAAEPLLRHLRALPGVKKVVLAGSFRRCKETLGDLDILVTAKRGCPVMRHLAAYDAVTDILTSGNTKSTVRLRNGIQVDVRLMPQASFGAALHYFTGSKSHNIAIRNLGRKKGLKINEYGVFKGKRKIAGKTEAEVFRTVGLPYIEPELRRGRGEIEAAGAGRLPRLIKRDDIRGDLHCHTRATDGHHSIEQMARAALELGYDYLAVTDHSQHVTVAKGLDERGLFEQIKAIDRLNAKLDGIVVLKGCEVDILSDGSLDLPDRVLRELDLTVCAIHYDFTLAREKQTERILRAMDNPYFRILAHPTGRLINERPAYDMDLERVLIAARDRGRWLEVNAHPYRLDLAGDACRQAKELSLRLVISTDAHSVTDLDFMQYGVEQARRGWLERNDIINTCSLPQLRKLLRG